MTKKIIVLLVMALSCISVGFSSVNFGASWSPQNLTVLTTNVGWTFHNEKINDIKADISFGFGRDSYEFSAFCLYNFASGKISQYQKFKGFAGLGAKYILNNDGNNSLCLLAKMQNCYNTDLFYTKFADIQTMFSPFVGMKIYHGSADATWNGVGLCIGFEVSLQFEIETCSQKD